MLSFYWYCETLLWDRAALSSVWVLQSSSCWEFEIDFADACALFAVNEWHIVWFFILQTFLYGYDSHGLRRHKIVIPILVNPFRFYELQGRHSIIGEANKYFNAKLYAAKWKMH